jgi:hypothetical protein
LRCANFQAIALASGPAASANKPRPADDIVGIALVHE